MSTTPTPREQVPDALGAVIIEVPPRPWKHQIGEIRLMAAVLEDAINVLRKRPRSRAGREAREWLLSRDMTYPFSYERICEALDLDPESVRRGVTLPGSLVRLPVQTLAPSFLAQTA